MSDEQASESTQKEEAPSLGGVFYCHHAGEPEQKLPGRWPRFEDAIWRVDSRQGGYVEYRSATGEVKERHPRTRSLFTVPTPPTAKPVATVGGKGRKAR